MVLCMNKIDLIKDQVISEKQAKDLSTEIGLTLYKTSVKNNISVNEIFENLAIEYIKRGNHLRPPVIESIQDVQKENLNKKKR
jgi:GTPase SAR1 family protein